jgi:Zn-dependent peptidase ImmA (M78 family)
MEIYQLRGNRVSPKEVNEIKSIALHVGTTLKLTSRRRKKVDASLEVLSKWGITVDVIPDHEWLGVTKGHYDPLSLTISIPEAIYVNACKGEKEALFVVLHELGHLFLSHKALLHDSRVKATISEDAEWQADTFAEVLLESMGYETMQYSFDFYM